MIRVMLLGALLAFAAIYAGLWRPEIAEIYRTDKMPISPQMWKWINASPSFNHQ